MLKRLHIKNFTVFADAEFEFGPGLNVIVGTNGTGKSHVLKLGYAVAQTVAFAEQTKRNKTKDEFNELDFDLSVGIALSSRLFSAFLPGTQNKLVRNSPGVQKAEISASFGNTGTIDFGFSIKYSEHPHNSVLIERPIQSSAEGATPVFIPAKEILSLMPDIIGISKINPELFDSTYTDLATQLTIRVPQNLPSFAQPVLDTWSSLMQGTIQSEDGRFYFQPSNGSRFRVGLAAEGFRKLGTLAHLLANGSITEHTTLFWDEPEANLNPSLLRELATVLAKLARQGFQIILATHSLSLLKQFHILSRQTTHLLSREEGDYPLPIRYFGLNAASGEETLVIKTVDFELLPDIVALDVELAQADALEEIFAQEDQQPDANNN